VAVAVVLVLPDEVQMEILVLQVQAGLGLFLLSQDHHKFMEVVVLAGEKIQLLL
jgi:hypothetical protein